MCELANLFPTRGISRFTLAMTKTLDFQPYARSPRIDALGGTALAIRLLRAATKKPSKPVAATLRKIHQETVALREESKARARTKPEVLRPLDARFDNGWSALRDRVACWPKVASPRFAKDRKRAEQLLAAYFPEGVAFVLLAYEAEWVKSGELLARFDEEGAAKDIARLAGEPFLSNVREHHEDLGVALGLSGKGSKERQASSTGIAERVTALADAIGEYTRRLSGEVELSKSASVKAFLAAVEPLDLFRAAAASGVSEPIDVTEPIPTPPAG